jgi:hypothetical protein
VTDRLFCILAARSWAEGRSRASNPSTDKLSMSPSSSVLEMSPAYPLMGYTISSPAPVKIRASPTSL